MKNFDFAAKTEELFAPVRSLNELAVASVERVVDLQLTSARKYATVALDSVKAAAAVTDLEGAKSFAAAQGEVARKTAEDLVADGKVLAQLGKDYSTEVQTIVKAGLEKAMKVAA